MSESRWSVITPLRFCDGDWVYVSKTSTHPLQVKDLRIATLNVLTDNHEPFIIVKMLRPMERYRKILKELAEIDADVVGMNEVTSNFLTYLQSKLISGCLLLKSRDDPWVQQNYYLSDAVIAGDKTYNGTLSSFGYQMGNLLLTKFPCETLFHYTFQDKWLKRGEPVIIVCMFPQFSWSGPIIGVIPDRRGRKVGFCTVHFTARSSHHESRRNQLQQLMDVIFRKNKACDDLFLFGDFNLHHSNEESILSAHHLVDLWSATHHPTDLSFTFDAKTNSLIQMKYFTLERRRMRLDRIVLHSKEEISGKSLWFPKSPVRIFANKAVYEGKWDYLYCSDHFGLHVDVTCNADECYKNNLISLVKEEKISIGWKFAPVIWICCLFLIIQILWKIIK
jgi:endonuclease/exonuclease/phosphatase family metal-dependent hydrolase